MIKGKVDLIKNYGASEEEVIYSDNNMIVDGAGEIISFLMTLPPDGDQISSASSVYDVSNYTIRAISFGKAPLHYYYNAHEKSGPAEYARNASGEIWVSAVSVSGASSYTPAYYLPDAPTPTDQYLVYFGGITAPEGWSSTSAFSSQIFNQNVNLYPFKDTVINKIVVSGVTVDIIPSETDALLDGAYPPSGGITVKLVNGTEPYNTIVSASLSGTFNSAGSMDFRGYVNAVSGTNSLSGLITSSLNVSTNGIITYIITIAGGDCAVANLYGGITQIGIWAYDLEENLNSGFTPPYSFSRYPEQTGTYVEPLKYKLFAKKVFNENIVKIRDSGGVSGLRNHQNLTIKWSLYFV